MVTKPRFEVVKRAQLSTNIFTAIESAVMRGDFKPGQRLKEAELAEEFGVSRGPVREALQELENRGIVIRVPSRGTFVAQWSSKEIEDFYIFRMHTEGLSARLAAKRKTVDDEKELGRLVGIMEVCFENLDFHRFLDTDAEFHYCVALIADCAPLTSVIETIRLRMRLLMVWDKGIHGSPEQFRETLNSHKRIATAISKGDPDTAETEMRSHIRTIAKRLKLAWAEEDS